jgi:hypothetical protein
MKLLGDLNWYLPGWLEWLPEIHIEGKPPVDDIVIDLIDGAIPELV